MVVGIGELLGAVDTIMPDCGGEVWKRVASQHGNLSRRTRDGDTPPWATSLWGEKFEYASNLLCR
jgi:hypothetical protein